MKYFPTNQTKWESEYNQSHSQIIGFALALDQYSITMGSHFTLIHVYPFCNTLNFNIIVCMVFDLDVL